MPTFLNKNRQNRWLPRILYAICVLLLVLDFVLPRHADLPVEKIPAFYALFGLLAAMILVLVARWLRTLLRRPEDYYD